MPGGVGATRLGVGRWTSHEGTVRTVGNPESSGREWVIRFSSVPLTVFAATVIVGILGRSWFIGLLWGSLVVLAAVLSWRPFKLSTSGTGPRIEYLEAFRWLQLPTSEIAALRYGHALSDLRGRALLRADLTDGRTVRIPGTAGKYWFRRPPTIPTTSIPRRRLHLVSTVQVLALIQQRLGVDVDTYDAVSMNPRRQ